VISQQLVASTEHEDPFYFNLFLFFCNKKLCVWWGKRLGNEFGAVPNKVPVNKAPLARREDNAG
jgi:hypothetical protein